MYIETDGCGYERERERFIKCQCDLGYGHMALISQSSALGFSMSLELQGESMCTGH